MSSFGFLKKILIVLLAVFHLSGVLSFAQNADSSRAKYVFYFIGDGMGFAHVSLTEAYLATEKGLIGRERLTFSKFPVMGMLSTYSASNMITCSSAAGTALATGYKTKNYMLGMNKDSVALESVAHKIHKRGIPVGIMTTVTIDHATPASFYGYSASRKDYFVLDELLAKSGFDFFAGGGFEGVKDKRNRDNYIYNLLSESGYTIAQGLGDYETKKGSSDKMILIQDEGVNSNILPTMWKRDNDDLTLSQMVESSIEFLTKNDKSDNGFFIMAEGGQIDWSAHSHDVPETIFEVIDFDNAIKVAYDFYLKHPDETLIIVTADHETGGLALGRGKGYNIDLSPIVGMRREHLNRVNQKDSLIKSENSKLTVENYLIGASRDSASVAYKIGWSTKSHTGSDVPLFAIGAGSQLFSGAMDNTDVPKRICEAMDIPFNTKVDTYYERMADFRRERPITSNDIVFLGNSITYGAKDISKYFPVAAKAIEKRGGRLVNRGIIGESTLHFYERLDEIVNAKPAKLFIMGGVNDLSNDVSAEDITERLRMIVKRVKSESPKTKIYLESLLPFNESFKTYKKLSGKTKEVAVINEMIKRMAKEERVQFIDLYPYFVTKGTDSLMENLTGDGLHITDEGYKIWASRLYKFVK